MNTMMLADFLCHFSDLVYAGMFNSHYGDDPSDELAVDLGYTLATAYGNTVTRSQVEVIVFVGANVGARFEAPPANFSLPGLAVPQVNGYGPNHFDNPP